MMVSPVTVTSLCTVKFGASIIRIPAIVPGADKVTSPRAEVVMETVPVKV